MPYDFSSRITSQHKIVFVFILCGILTKEIHITQCQTETSDEYEFENTIYPNTYIPMSPSM